MAKKLIVGNWKQNKTPSKALDWLSGLSLSQTEEKQFVLCPGFTLLHLLKEKIEEMGLPLLLGAQDFPAFADGAHTGEESVETLKEYVKYAIIGHSERRRDFSETDELLQKKVNLAKSCDIEPIYCVQDRNTFVPVGVKIVAYEPIFAIGTGNPETPENAKEVALAIKSGRENLSVIYGGSVNPENVHSYTGLNELDGVLLGSASLDPVSFSQICEKA